MKKTVKVTAKKKQYTAEEKKAYFAQRKQEVEQALVEGVAKCYTEGNFRNYLDTIAKFHNYSIRNCMLIAWQNPDATLVAGYTDWNKKFKRHVKAGEKGIKILAPAPFKMKVETEDKDGNKTEEEITVNRYKLVPVFDVSQTEGEDLPTICNELTADVDDYEALIQKIIAIATVPVEFENITNGSHGYFDRVAKRIAIKEGMPQAQTVKTLVHEIAHSILHDDAFADIPRAIKEVQAESVAYMVCKAIGIDSDDYSFEYVASWAQQDMKALTEQMNIVRTTADAMTAKILG